MECISWWTKKRGNLVFLLVITSKYSVYSVPIRNSCGFVINLFLMAIEADGSRSLMAMISFLCFTGRLTKEMLQV